MGYGSQSVDNFAPNKSLIVPLHGTHGYLSGLWSSLISVSSESTEIILVDDGSNIDFARTFPGISEVPNIVVVTLPSSKGFAGAVNAGIERARGNLIYLINSDTIFDSACIEKLGETLIAQPDIGVVSATLIFPQNGLIQHAGLHYTETNHFHTFRNLRADHPLLSGSRDVQAVAFAFVGFRRETLDRLGPFGEDYYNGYEDLDYCFRLLASGYRIHVDGQARAYHWERQSGPRRQSWRKDNVARLWKDRGNQITPDLARYLGESLDYIFHSSPHLEKLDFCRVDLFSGPPSEVRQDDVFSSSLLNIVEHWDYRQPDARSHWLPHILPVSSVQHERPILFVVDNIEEMRENKYWFDLRRTYCRDDIIQDFCGNSVLPSADGY